MENSILGILKKERDITSVFGGNYCPMGEAEYMHKEDLMPKESQQSQLALLA